MRQQILEKAAELIKQVIAERCDARTVQNGNARLYSHPADSFAGLSNEEIFNELLLVLTRKSKQPRRVRDFLSASYIQAAAVLAQQKEILDKGEGIEVEEQ